MPYRMAETMTIHKIQNVENNFDEERALTEKQAALVKAYISGETAGHVTKSAIAAGYEKRNAAVVGSVALKLPHVVAAIDAALREEIGGALTVQAVAVIRRIITDEEAPLKLRGDMAARVVEYSGIVERTQLEKARQTGLDAAAGNGQKRLGEMTRAELEAVVRQGAGILAAAAALPPADPVIVEGFAGKSPDTLPTEPMNPSNSKALTLHSKV
jgi:hypothetical protein